jgi:hypothetical protein
MISSLTSALIVMPRVPNDFAELDTVGNTSQPFC